MEISHFKPQHHFICDPEKKINVDYTGRFETLEIDFRNIAETLGIDATLPKSNSSNHKHYKDYYNDETIQIVGEVYALDLDLLGYDFNGVVENGHSQPLTSPSYKTAV